MLSAVLQAQAKGKAGKGQGRDGEGRRRGGRGGGEGGRGGGEGGGEEERGEGRRRGGMKGVGEKKGFRERHRKRIGCIVHCSQHPGHWECLWPVHLPPPHLLLADDNAPIHHNVIE